MTKQSADATEQDFFSALIDGSREVLDAVLADDFVLIDVMTGSEIPKAVLLDVVEGGTLKFESIDRIEYRVRTYGATAVITGRTQMRGQYGGEAFGASSRYTHVFVEDGGRWRMVAAQGTQITAPVPAA